VGSHWVSRLLHTFINSLHSAPNFKRFVLQVSTQCCMTIYIVVLRKQQETYEATFEGLTGIFGEFQGGIQTAAWHASAELD
jgi:hypothetical protein